MISMFEAACVVFTSLPIHTQINLAHSALQVGVWTLKQSYAMYKYMQPQQQEVKFITLQAPDEDGFINISAD